MAERDARSRGAGRTDDPLAMLDAFERLEVGPTQVRPDGLTVPYRVVGRGAGAAPGIAVDERTELSYKWEEPVFAEGDPVAANLAALIGVQPALNYGLFCRRIVLHDRFDRHDRAFLAAMASNTAREIYVNKLLRENPFLVGPAASTPLIRREDYLRAELEFAGGEPAAPDGARPGPGPGPDAAAGTGAGTAAPSRTAAAASEAAPTAGPAAAPRSPRAPWGEDPRRVAVLSSGGKDSLLSFGLLREVGCEVHPVFVNESGRHWFTALNAYRHFRDQVPNTARVWTDVDRLFVWMLRRLPFVRPDFAELRADIYPVRLWTVAVFLFGALPLLRRRGIGRLVIGDEYDTSRRASHRGIPHFDGYYDQSRWFDNELSRFFHRKGWRVAQFSILRPLSELLIEKTLVERYGDLQALQVSCHAAHKDGELVRPCGRCEKCRRIVGMLKALGADPTRCGYYPEQVRQCLAALAEHGVHQEAAGERHLAYLLRERKLIPAESPRGRSAAAHPEIARLRFDRERSPVNAVPRDLREPLLRIQMQHAEGAVQRSGRLWLPYDPFREADLGRPYPFDSTAAAAGPGGAREHILGELTWPEARRRFREVDIALLPVGSIEQHGPHLPLDTDAFDAEWLARRVAERCTSPRPLVLPLIPYGVSYHHDDFAGTLSVSPETLSRLVHEIGMAAARNGATKLVIVNGHGGNVPALHFAAQMINRDAHIFTTVETGETSAPELDSLVETPNDVHAGEGETSTALANRPHLVRLKEARPHVPSFSSRYLDFSSRRSVEWYGRTSRISRSGVMGDPTRASKEKGEKLLELMVTRLVEFVEDLKRLSLDEIHQRQY